MSKQKDVKTMDCIVGGAFSIQFKKKMDITQIFCWFRISESIFIIGLDQLCNGK